MKFVKKIALVALLGLAFSFTAAAQDRVIRFKLDRATHIGFSVVPAGEYRMAIYSNATRMAIVTPEDHAGASVLALPTRYESSTCRNASVTLAPVGRELALTAVCMGEAELALQFPVDRSKRVAAQTTATAALAGAQ